MNSADFSVMVPTRGSDQALNAIAENIASRLGDAPLRVMLNRANAPNPSTWQNVLDRCPDARFHLSPGGGVARARNLALRVAPTDVVVFVDDDVLLPLGALPRLVERLRHTAAGVATARIVPAASAGTAAELHRRFLGLDRGLSSRRFTRQDLAQLSPMDSWELGVGAAFAVQRAMLDRVASPPAFDESLSNGRFCGGAEDVDFFLQCLHADVPVVYCPEAVFEHRYPEAMNNVRTKMRRYARADGAFYAKWGRFLAWSDVVGDLADWAHRVRLHARRAAARDAHVPLAALIEEPFDKLVGAAWWSLVGSGR